MSLLLTIYTWLIGFAAVSAASIITATSWYDLRAIATKAVAQKAVRSVSRRHQPHIAVIVYAHNHDSTITACLQAIFRSQYHNFDCIVVATAPSQGTAGLVRAFQGRHPSAPLQLYAPRARTSRYQALRRAYQRLKAHDFVVILDGGMIIPAQLLKRSVAQFIIEPRTDQVSFGTYTPLRHQLAGLIPRLLQLSHDLWEKAMPAHSRTAATTPVSAACYRHAAFVAKRPQQLARRSYLSTPAILRPGIAPLPTLPRTWYGRVATWVVAALVVTVITSLVSLALSLQGSSLLLIGWLIVVGWALTSIWSTATSPRAEKIALSFSAPAAPLLLYLWCLTLLLGAPYQALHRLALQWHRTSRNTNRHRHERNVFNNILSFKARN